MPNSFTSDYFSMLFYQIIFALEKFSVLEVMISKENNFESMLIYVTKSPNNNNPPKPDEAPGYSKD